MLSIITAVHNQLAMNQLFLEHLRRWTRLPFELIIVDNKSEDGSADFFRAQGATVIANDGNYSYPHCQNQGIVAARFDLLAFLNNDIIVSPDWDQRLLQVMDHHGLELASCCGVERLQSRFATRFCRKKWSLVRRTVGMLGPDVWVLRLMHRAMYGDWERFTQRRWERFGLAVRNGFVGSSVVMRRSALEKIGLWDERIQAADFDLFLRAKARSVERRDIRPVRVALGVFVHHYVRMTVRAKPPQFKDQAALLPLAEKWGGERLAEYCEELD